MCHDMYTSYRALRIYNAHYAGSDYTSDLHEWNDWSQRNLYAVWGADTNDKL